MAAIVCLRLGQELENAVGADCWRLVRGAAPTGAPL